MASASASSAAVNKQPASATTTADDNVRVIRETIESVVIAFILAFLFKTFAAEMFVIPTGSMAPTLQGRHKDVRCPLCNFRYRTSASAEVNTETNVPIPGKEVHASVCPMCRFRHTIGLEPAYQVKDKDGHDVDAFRFPLNWRDNSYNGDRIVVAKFVYDITEPKRWDVVVFKFPDGAKINYIKRLIGLPGETIRIIDGDIYVEQGDGEFQITRKSPQKVRAMLQDVYDNDYVLDPLVEHGWPERWCPWSAAESPGAWKHPESADQKPNRKAFETDGKSPDLQWLRYVHTPPTDRIWQLLYDESSKQWRQTQIDPLEVKATTAAVHDFASYNANEETGYNIVTDLALDCQFNVEAAQGEMVLELVKKGHRCQCHFDLKSGDATLSISGLPEYARAGKAAMTPGKHHLLFTNVDSQLLLWVDDKFVEFSGGDGHGTAYEPFGNQAVVGSLPVVGRADTTDASPVGIAISGVAAQVEHLRVLRDVFYGSPQSDPSNMGWYQRNNNKAVIGPDEFWMLGDNSPESADGRSWGTVNRNLLTGKALFVYWPHSFDHTSPDGGMWFPFFPNFGQMGRVR